MDADLNLSRMCDLEAKLDNANREIERLEEAIIKVMEMDLYHLTADAHKHVLQHALWGDDASDGRSEDVGAGWGS
jgi:hypothetical protein